MSKRTVAKKCSGTRGLPSGNGWFPRSPKERHEKEVRKIFEAVNNGIKALWKLNEGSVNIRDHLERTPIMVAAKNGQCSVVEELMKELGADPDLIDINGRTALQHAILEGNRATAKILVDTGADWKSDLELAVRQGRKKMAERIVEIVGEEKAAPVVEESMKKPAMLSSRVEKVDSTANAVHDLGLVNNE
ncbi:MAG: ankyrin repeat domain-containing protein [Candidatus Micrarchaeia archaeon]